LGSDQRFYIMGLDGAAPFVKLKDHGFGFIGERNFGLPKTPGTLAGNFFQQNQTWCPLSYDPQSFCTIAPVVMPSFCSVQDSAKIAWDLCLEESCAGGALVGTKGRHLSRLLLNGPLEGKAY